MPSPILHVWKPWKAMFLRKWTDFLEKLPFKTSLSQRIVAVNNIACTISQDIRPLKTNFMFYISSRIYFTTRSPKIAQVFFAQAVSFIEHTCAYARWALMHRFLSVFDWTKTHWTKIHWTIIHISNFWHILSMVRAQAINSHSPVTVKKVYDTGRWAHFNVKLHFFFSLLFS